MLYFTIPTIYPKTLDELHEEVDEVSSLVYLEDALAKELKTIREYGKDRAPLGLQTEQEPPPSDAGEPSAVSDSMDDDESFDDEQSFDILDRQFSDGEMDQVISASDEDAMIV